MSLMSQIFLSSRCRRGLAQPVPFAGRPNPRRTGNLVLRRDVVHDIKGVRIREQTSAPIDIRPGFLIDSIAPPLMTGPSPA